MRRRPTVATEQAVTQHATLLRPPERTWRQKIQDFFWDKRNRTCLTRSPINWLSISFYYFIFLAVVLIILYVSMKIAEAVASREENRPQYVLGDSMLGSSPSVNYFPLKGDSNILWLVKGQDYNKTYVTTIAKEFECYRRKNGRFNASQFNSCGSPPFGYNDMSPCLFFRLNRLLMWKPRPFIRGDILPDEIPEKVKKSIETSQTPKLWLSCNGTTPKDRDHITEDFFQVQGDGGFDPSVFPFKNQDDFLDPIIAIKFKDTKPKKTLFTFTCTVWAKKLNHKHSKVDVNYYFE